MTTHDQMTDTATPLEQHDTAGLEHEVGERENTVQPAFSSAETVQPPPVSDPSTETVANTERVANAETVETSPSSETRSEESLFDADKLSGLRSRWTDIQAEFVDDPRECVQNADALVSDVVDQLTAGFAGALSRLEEQWARGEEVSTEDLRVALRRYRGFFERLLEV